MGSNPAAPTIPPVNGRARETMTTIDTPQTSRAAALWLAAVVAVIVAMVVVGGATRATGSGLSITEWQPVSGALPPLTQATAWERLFALYRATPQYRLVNVGMSLSQFQGIFWWEWAHRLLGRVLGVVFFVPFFALLILKRLPRRLIIPCLILFALGGLQGFVGWRMVQSGLADRTSVAPEWLAIHQGTALMLLMAILWTALEAWNGPAAGKGSAGWRRAGAAFLAAVYVQCLLGALVAGNHAGLVDADWPLMAGRVFPVDYWHGSMLATFIRGAAAVQFNHRLWAYGLPWPPALPLRSPLCDPARTALLAIGVHHRCNPGPAGWLGCGGPAAHCAAAAGPRSPVHRCLPFGRGYRIRLDDAPIRCGIIIPYFVSN